MKIRTFLWSSLSLVGLMACSAFAQSNSSWHGLPVVEGPYEASVKKTDAQWQALLKPAAYSILRHGETERPFRNDYWDEHRSGTFYCAATGAPLFSSKDKFESGTGWPSFTRPLDQKAVVLKTDTSFGMLRVEVLDAASGSHLGHVFDDGPSVEEGGTGLRYCMNSGALIFVPEGQDPPQIVKAWSAAATKSR